jgi:hypothetical protein
VVLTAAARSVLSAAVIERRRCRTVTVSLGCMRSMAAEAQPILLLRSSAAAYRPSTSGSVAKPSCSTLAQTWSALISAGPGLVYGNPNVSGSGPPMCWSVRWRRRNGEQSDWPLSWRDQLPESILGGIRFIPGGR